MNYTRKAILDEFEVMLREMPFSKITVTAIVNRTQISSNTFYYHFHDIYGLLEAWLKQISHSIRKEVTEDEDWTEIMKRYLHFMKEHPVLAYHLNDQIERPRLERYVLVSVHEEFREAIQARLKDADLDENTLKAITDVYCYTLTGVTFEFIYNHMDDDIDEIVDRIGPILTQMGRAVVYSTK